MKDNILRLQCGRIFGFLRLCMPLVPLLHNRVRFSDNILFLIEMMVEHVYKRIQFGLIILVVGASFIVRVMVSHTCSDCDPTHVLDSDGGKVPEYCPVS